MMDKKMHRALTAHLRDRYRTKLTRRDCFEIGTSVLWPILLALVLGGFGFIIMVASQQ